MQERILAARTDWIQKVRAKYPKSVPSPNTSPDTSSAFLAYLASEYTASVQKIFDLPELVGPDEQLASSVDYIRLQLGSHRASDSIHAGYQKTINIHPQILPTSEADAQRAEGWALAQQHFYPKEQNAAQRLARTHSLIVRVEWGSSPKIPYEIDTEPSGLGLLMHFSPQAREKIIKHRSSLGRPLWAYMQSDRMDDSIEYLVAPLCTPEELMEKPSSSSGLLLPFMRQASDLSEHWHQNSILPVKHMEDKAHLIKMGLARDSGDIKAWKNLLERMLNGEPTVIRRLVGSCATGMSIYKGTGEKMVMPQVMHGFDTQSKILSFIREAGASSLLWRPFIEPGLLSSFFIKLTKLEEKDFGPADKLYFIRRYFVLIHPSGQIECIGGLTTARNNARIHGANDALMFIQAPPKS